MMNQSKITKNYPKPKKYGGILIRKVIALLKQLEIKRPIDSHILIACSGGADSIALSHLICRYGRRVVNPDKIHLLHINHGWRGKESNSDALFVKDFAQSLGVPFVLKKLNPKEIKKGESWENHARIKRNEIFQKLLSNRSSARTDLKQSQLVGKSKKYAFVFTAHHGNDLAETLLWRFCTGSIEHHDAGIFALKNKILRPFLTVKKEEIFEYLKEEGQEYREDQTNENTDFLRNGLRKKLIPEIERLFPRFTENMIHFALGAQNRKALESQDSEIFFALRDVLSKKIQGGLRKNQWSEVKKQSLSKNKKIEISLPKKWVLRKESSKENPVNERWILEKK